MSTMVEIVAHVLGIVGMAGVWTVPSRLWPVVISHRLRAPLTTEPRCMVLAAIVLLAIAIAAHVAICHSANGDRASA
jgi:hypothetical protein